MQTGGKHASLLVLAPRRCGAGSINGKAGWPQKNLGTERRQLHRLKPITRACNYAGRTAEPNRCPVSQRWAPAVRDIRYRATQSAGASVPGTAGRGVGTAATATG
ncbi:hypothetical protein GCM10010360_33810 [Streptomyces nogalater]